MKLYTCVNKWYSVRQTTCALRNARIKRPINVIIIIIIIYIIVIITQLTILCQKWKQADKILEQIMGFIASYDLQSLKSYWDHLERRVFCHLEYTHQHNVNKIRIGVLRYLVLKSRDGDDDNGDINGDEDDVTDDDNGDDDDVTDDDNGDDDDDGGGDDDDGKWHFHRLFLCYYFLENRSGFTGIKANLYSVGGFELIFINHIKSAAFSRQTSENNLKPP